MKGTTSPKTASRYSIVLRNECSGKGSAGYVRWGWFFHQRRRIATSCWTSKPPAKMGCRWILRSCDRHFGNLPPASCWWKHMEICWKVFRKERDGGAKGQQLKNLKSTKGYNGVPWFQWLDLLEKTQRERGRDVDSSRFYMFLIILLRSATCRTRDLTHEGFLELSNIQIYQDMSRYI